MTRTLEQLLKLSTHKVEQKQQDIAKLVAAEQAIEADQSAARAKLMTVVQEAAANTEALLQSGAYSARLRNEIHNLQYALTKLREELTNARDQLRALFAEQKRYEVLIQNKQEAAAKAAAKKAQTGLDEIAGQRR